MTTPIRVLVVDDSAIIRTLWQEVLNAQPGIEVVATAHDPYDAREKIKHHHPDVLTLDVEMPKMDGLSFLEKIMTLRPMPVVMVSTLTGKGTDTAIAALALGAVECIAKPNIHSQQELDLFARALADKIHTARQAKIRQIVAKPVQGNFATGVMRSGKSLTIRPDAPTLIAIGASTGGVEALGAIIPYLPATMPPIVITQHMPAGFTASFAQRLNGLSALNVVEASDGLVLASGVAAIAPGGRQLQIRQSAGQIRCIVSDAPPVNNHKPSVDVLFDSVVDQIGAHACGLILTGMGKDGAKGLLALRQCGAHTIGQDEASCVVYGMPRHAFEIGAVSQIVPLPHIARVLIQRCFYPT